jgi:hypothetical protein
VHDLGAQRLVVALCLPLLAACAPRSFTATGDLSAPRGCATATLLASGKVLFAGGASGSQAIATAELFDPAAALGAGAFGAAASLSTARSCAAAVRLGTGQVLVAGGRGAGGTLASAELYDPAADAFRPVGDLLEARQGATATLLLDGRVLLAGGTSTAAGQAAPLASAELYEPAADGGMGAFSAAGTMAVARAQHTATLLADGRVLLAGGQPGDEPSAELFDPSRPGAFQPAGPMVVSRFDATATRLPGGEVLIAGGAHGQGQPLATAELYRPDAGAFSPVASLADARRHAVAVLLGGGQVLIAGGLGEAVLSTAERFQRPAADGGAAGAFLPTGSLLTARDGASAVRLLDGRVLVVGGFGVSAGGVDIQLTSAELYQP